MIVATRVAWLVVPIALAALHWSSAQAQQWRTLYEEPFPPGEHYGRAHEWLIAGQNNSDQDSEFWLRADDGRSSNYASRINHRIAVPPGPFRIRVPVLALRTPNGRSLDPDNLKMLRLFQKSTSPALQVHQVQGLAPPTLPHGTLALDFGPSDSGVFPGFENVAPGDRRITGKQARAIARPGVDPLIDDGVAGIDEVQLRVAPGRWQISLWIDDLGEWEYMPHDLARRIDINGEPMLTRALTPERWFDDVYRAGREREALLDGDPWVVLRQNRGAPLTVPVTVGSSGSIVIRLSGATPTAKYLAAALVEPLLPGTVVASVEANRRERFLDSWRVSGTTAQRTQKAQIWRLASGSKLLPNTRPTSSMDSDNPLVAARNSVVTFEAAVVGLPDGAASNALFEWSAPRLANGASLQIIPRAGFWRFRREGNLLVPTADELRPIDKTVRLDSAVPRRIHLQIDIPPNAVAGLYQGQIRLTGSRIDTPLTLPIYVRVLPLTLPQLQQPIGVYLRSPPHIDWFPQFSAQRDTTMTCDLALFRQLGLSGVAPPLTTPSPGNEMAFARDLARVRMSGMTTPLVAYTPAKKLLERDQNLAINQLARVTLGLRDAGLPQPLWSIADEPSNPESANQNLMALAATLRNAAPGIKLTGHLNAPGDRALLRAFDVVLVNSGYGVDQRDITDIREAGIEPWLYNMSRPRLAAGFYLWRVGANGYLQWHARMPTAAPYDPTDGREDDYQMLYPSLDACAASPDINARLFDIADAALDLRWLRWLEQTASDTQGATALLDALRSEIPDNWRGADELGTTAPARWRDRITAFAAQNVGILQPPVPRNLQR